MKLERIEELLRSQPPDEPPYGRELLPSPPIVRVAPLVRGRRSLSTTLNTATVITVLVGLVVLGLVLGPLAATPAVRPSPSTTASLPSEASPPLGAIPWIDATPTPSATPEPTPDPRSLPACTAADLVLTAGGWGGATGSLAGGASIVNLSSNPCTVGGKPAIELLDSTEIIIAQGSAAQSAAGGEVVVLPPGGVADVITVWGNWCVGAPRRPLSIHLSLPRGGGDLAATIREAGPDPRNDVPRCDDPGAPSTIGVPLAFRAPEPSVGGYQPRDCTADELGAYLGDWGAAAGISYANLVVLNRGSLDCLLGSSPTVELRDSRGHRVVVAGSQPLPASASSILLPPGWAAFVRLGYADWCSAAPTTPLRADLVVGSAQVTVDSRSAIPVPPCMSAPQTSPPTLFYDGLLAIPGSPIAREPDPADTLPVSVALSPLPATVPGGTLDYAVTLTNLSAFDKSLNLAALCPTYIERLFLPDEPKSIETHLALNCGPVGVLAANVGATFTMRLPIPADSPTGTATLVWQLGTSGPAAKATFRIGS